MTKIPCLMIQSFALRAGDANLDEVASFAYYEAGVTYSEPFISFSLGDYTIIHFIKLMRAYNQRRKLLI